MAKKPTNNGSGNKLLLATPAAAAPVSAGAVSGVPDTGWLRSINLCAGTDAATLTIQTDGAAGAVLCKIGAAAGLSASRRFRGGVPFSSLYATVTGTSPVYDVEI